MPGHMGNVQVTVQNLEIVRVDTENNLLLVKGAVPGPKKSFGYYQRDSKVLIIRKEEHTNGKRNCL